MLAHVVEWLISGGGYDRFGVEQRTFAGTMEKGRCAATNGPSRASSNLEFQH
jgi:hypothetical protein